MRMLPALLLATGLAACSVPGPREPDRYFVLDAGAVPAAAAGAAPAVYVAPTSATGFYDTQDIAYSRSPGTRAYYQFNRWTERPARSIHRQLAMRLGGGAPRDGLRLETRLDEIFHEASREPGTAHVALTAEIVEAHGGRVLARRAFALSAPAASYDAPGAVQGFNQALAGVMAELEAWVAAEAARQPSR